MFNVESVTKSIEKAKEDVQKEVAKGAAKVKTAREDGEKKIDEAAENANKSIDNSKLPDPVKKAAKDGVSAGNKAAKEAVEKAKEAAKDAVEKAEEKANEAVDEAEEKVNEAVDETAKKVEEIEHKAADGLAKIVDDSNLPDPVKDAAKKGIDAIHAAGDKAIGELKDEAKEIVKSLAENAKGLIGDLKDKALDILGFKSADPVEDAPSAPTVTPPAPASTDTARTFDHRGGFNFRIELGGVAAGAFTAVDGLSAEVEMVEYAGGMDMYTRQIPGRPKIAPITLKKGYINTSALWDWMKSTMDGTLKFENVSIVLLADDGDTEIVRYDLQETWPSRWSGFQLDAQSSGAMIEELELQARSISRVAA